MDDDLENIKIQLKDFLKGASSLVILGIGNDIRGDDGLGPYILRNYPIKRKRWKIILILTQFLI